MGALAGPGDLVSPCAISAVPWLCPAWGPAGKGMVSKALLILFLLITSTIIILIYYTLHYVLYVI